MHFLTIIAFRNTLVDRQTNTELHTHTCTYTCTCFGTDNAWNFKDVLYSLLGIRLCAITFSMDCIYLHLIKIRDINYVIHACGEGIELHFIFASTIPKWVIWDVHFSRLFQCQSILVTRWCLHMIPLWR